MDWFLMVPLSMAALLVIHALYHFWPRGDAAKIHYLFREWRLGAAARGLNGAQQTAELSFRLAWAELRRRASNAVVADPKCYKDAIAEHGRVQAMVLAARDKTVAKNFLAVLNNAPLEDILYEDAMAALHSMWDAEAAACTERARLPDAAVIAALTTR